MQRTPVVVITAAALSRAEGGKLPRLIAVKWQMDCIDIFQCLCLSVWKVITLYVIVDLVAWTSVEHLCMRFALLTGFGYNPAMR